MFKREMGPADGVSTPWLTSPKTSADDLAMSVGTQYQCERFTVANPDAAPNLCCRTVQANSHHSKMTSKGTILKASIPIKGHARYVYVFHRGATHSESES